MYEVRKVHTRAEWKQFVDLPWELYKKYPHWVPPLKLSVHELLDQNKNPFFSHAKIFALLGLKEGKVAGRIAGVIDKTHNDFHGEKTAFFGFFECIDDPELSKLMMDEVLKWVKAQGMTLIRGPMNPTTNYECGLLVDAFDQSPTIMMTYNPPYYANLIEASGFKKSKDLLAYDLYVKDYRVNERVLKVLERQSKKTQVEFRSLDMKRFDEEVELMAGIYNDSWEKNWGFIPMTLEEFKHTAKDLKMIVDPELVIIASVRGEPAAFAICLPDLNQVLAKIPDGRLFPVGLPKLLWNLKGPGRKKTIQKTRIIALGVRKKFETLGLGPMIYRQYAERVPRRGYDMAECSWILEDNIPMNRALEHLNATKTKTYRIYDRSLV